MFNPENWAANNGKGILIYIEGGYVCYHNTL